MNGHPSASLKVTAGDTEGSRVMNFRTTQQGMMTHRCGEELQLDKCKSGHRETVH